MTDTRVALGSERLPWLDDEPAAKPRKNSNDAWLIAAGALLLVAGGSYWLGMRTGHSIEQPMSSGLSAPLPAPRAAPPAAETQVPPVPEVNPAPMPGVRESAPPMARLTPQRRLARVRHELVRQAPAQPKLEAEPKTKQTAPSTGEKPLTLWPATQSAGAAGRIVRIGAFGTRQQAKLGWRYMVRAYPAVAHLPATVVESRNSRGRTFYRFQIGTTSQAHSEVLCQRMDKIHLSCAVVGLPWKPKGVER